MKTLHLSLCGTPAISLVLAYLLLLGGAESDRQRFFLQPLWPTEDHPDERAHLYRRFAALCICEQRGSPDRRALETKGVSLEKIEAHLLSGVPLREICWDDGGSKTTGDALGSRLADRAVTGLQKELS